MNITLRIVRASSREAQDLLSPRRTELAAAGFEVLYDETPADPTWPYAAASVEHRAKALTDGLMDKSTAVLCARGGYGASDLLHLIPWGELRTQSWKPIVGFSDTSALHSAFYTKLGWPGLHAPMPATVLWGQNGQREDIDQLLTLLRDPQARAWHGGINVRPVGSAAQKSPALHGKLFGGCLSVLTNMIGTPYFPGSLKGHILFFEDTGENAGRLLRFFNQWVQSGALNGVEAIVIGHLRGLGEKIEDSAPFVYERFAQFSPVPVFASPDFGHTSPNYPLGIGADATLTASRLEWRLTMAARSIS